MQYTKGPWKFSSGESSDTLSVTSIIGANNELVVGGEYDGIMVPFCGVETETECVANAKLVRAAPELLEACIKAMDECVDLIGTEAGNAIEAAIKAATE